MKTNAHEWDDPELRMIDKLEKDVKELTKLLADVSEQLKELSIATRKGFEQTFKQP